MSRRYPSRTTTTATSASSSSSTSPSSSLSPFEFTFSPTSTSPTSDEYKQRSRRRMTHNQHNTQNTTNSEKSKQSVTKSPTKASSSSISLSSPSLRKTNAVQSPFTTPQQLQIPRKNQHAATLSQIPSSATPTSSTSLTSTSKLTSSSLFSPSKRRLSEISSNLNIESPTAPSAPHQQQQSNPPHTRRFGSRMTTMQSTEDENEEHNTHRTNDVDDEHRKPDENDNETAAAIDDEYSKVNFDEKYEDTEENYILFGADGEDQENGAPGRPNKFAKKNLKSKAASPTHRMQLRERSPIVWESDEENENNVEENDSPRGLPHRRSYSRTDFLAANRPHGRRRHPIDSGMDIESAGSNSTVTASPTKSTTAWQKELAQRAAAELQEKKKFFEELDKTSVEDILLFE